MKKLTWYRKATVAWKAAGEVWKAVSSWIVTARLKVVNEGQKIPGGSTERGLTFLLL